MFSKILCPVDGSAHSLKAATLASEIAAKDGAQLTILTVAKELKMTDELKRYIEIEHLAGEAQYVLDEHTENIIQQAKEAARAAGVAKFDTEVKIGPLPWPVGGEAMGLRAAFAFIEEHTQNRT